MSLCLWTGNFTRVLQVFFYPLVGTGWLVWAEIGYFPSMSEKNREYAGIFQNGSLLPLFAGSRRGFFSWYFLRESGWCSWLLSQYCGVPLWLDPCGVFSSQTCAEPLTIHQLRFLVSCAALGFQGRSLFQEAVTPTICLLLILEAAVCPVSSLLLQIQDVMLIFKSVQLFACCWDRVAASKLLAWGTSK